MPRDGDDGTAGGPVSAADGRDENRGAPEGPCSAPQCRIEARAYIRWNCSRLPRVRVGPAGLARRACFP